MARLSKTDLKALQAIRNSVVAVFPEVVNYVLDYGEGKRRQRLDVVNRRVELALPKLAKRGLISREMGNVWTLYRVTPKGKAALDSAR